jgi:hypothetical protein
VSRTVAVTCGSQEFWAYDLALGIWLKKALDEIARQGWQGEPSPAAAELSDWATVAVLGSSSVLDLTPRSLTLARQDNFEGIATGIETWLESRERLSGPELAEWRLLDDAPISRADAPAVVENGTETAPVIDLGRALVSAVLGVLPPPPPATWWAIGFASERTTIAMRA